MPGALATTRESLRELFADYGLGPEHGPEGEQARLLIELLAVYAGPDPSIGIVRRRGYTLTAFAAAHPASAGAYASETQLLDDLRCESQARSTP